MLGGGREDVKEQRNLGHHVALSFGIKVIIAHGGSSSPGLCTSRTGVAGAPCSGQKRPGRPAFPKVAEEMNRGHMMVGRKHTKQHTHGKDLQLSNSALGPRFNGPPALLPYS